MPRTVPEAFKEFKTSLEITGLQKEIVSTRQQQIREAVESRLTILDSFLTGSYSRTTMIAPLSKADIDIFVVLHSSYFEQGGQANLLDRVKRVLKERYPKTPDISRNGQAVTISFEDFIVDVVPGFHRKGGGYLIPDSQSGTWIETDPKEHVEISTRANAAHDGDLVPLIKMIKSWNRSIDNHFHSFHLEALSWGIFENVTISNFPSGARFFFDKGKDLINKKNPDPAGYSGDLGHYINNTEKITEAITKFTTAYKRAIQAEEYQRKGYAQSAIDEWRKIFGDQFPAYGS